MSNTGRFAPSPSGDLHVGNLRTALLAWTLARQTGRRFVLRVEDIDRVREGAAARQVQDLRMLGLDWDGPVQYQSKRRSEHLQALETLRSKGLLFECFCSRKQIREAAVAPNGQVGHYPGTCRNLDAHQRDRKRAELLQQGRRPAWRLSPQVEKWPIEDAVWGKRADPIDCVVLQRGDGAVAYNLAAVVDDAHAGVDQVVRADDLLQTSSTQAYLAHELGFAQPTYVHVPLVVNARGDRLAKRDGAVTLRDLLALGYSVSDVIETIARSVGVQATTAKQFLHRFELARMPHSPWVFTPPQALTPPASQR
ncbi:tRNA glutamyl-Q(34) synthetase GluQRS [Gleimia hominis]|uniref:tRNA glutamyl-Q(34) synthetase GluQRS n=1 Tax=Gleimia hominis TaxID=595468 RepID=A0ABU3I8F3_9ACTO|nr:tRNA glutamyl-Q(34) synthetase GluQRS [Gleimia hominis]MDT3766662.1 tRNA glutamyl-Q(34) synthetase GluQRS [Gleimia hominis]